jgi:hypothetical protein
LYVFRIKGPYPINGKEIIPKQEKQTADKESGENIFPAMKKSNPLVK